MFIVQVWCHGDPGKPSGNSEVRGRGREGKREGKRGAERGKGKQRSN